MTDPRPRTFVLAVGLVLVGGMMLFLSPRSVIVVLQWVAGGLAAVAALHVFTHNSPSVWWTSSFDREVDPIVVPEEDETEWIRARLAGRRVRIGGGRVAVPPETLRLLRPLIEECISRNGGGSIERAAPDSVRAALSPLTLAVLRSDPTMRPGWWGTVRPDEHAVAAIVHHVLDDLKDIEALASPTKSST